MTDVRARTSSAVDSSDVVMVRMASPLLWFLILDAVHGAVHFSGGSTGIKQLKRPLASRSDRTQLVPQHEKLVLNAKQRDQDTFLGALQSVDTAWVDPHAMFEYEPPTEPRLEASQDKRLVLGKQPATGKKTVSDPRARTSNLLEPVDTAPCNLSCDCQEVRNELHTCKLSLAEESNETKKCNDVQYLRRYVKILTNKLPREPAENSPLHFKVRLMLTLQDYQIIETFLKSPNSHAKELEDVLVRLIGSSTPFEDADSYLWWTWALNVPAESVYVLLAGLAGTAVVFTLLVGLSFWQVVSRIFILLFVVSTLWHWNHLYHLQLAKKHAILEQGDVPVECRPSQMNWWLATKLWFRSAFTFSEDQCAKYYEAILVDPFWEVTPLMALSETIWKFLLHPLQLCGKFLGVFIRSLCSEIPVAALPFVATILVALFILILIMFCRYRVKLPFLLGTLEPVPSEPSQSIHQKVLRATEGAISGRQRSYVESLNTPNTGSTNKICDTTMDETCVKEPKSVEVETSTDDTKKSCGCSAEPNEPNSSDSQDSSSTALHSDCKVCSNMLETENAV